MLGSGPARLVPMTRAARWCRSRPGHAGAPTARSSSPPRETWPASRRPRPPRSPTRAPRPVLERRAGSRAGRAHVCSRAAWAARAGPGNEEVPAQLVALLGHQGGGLVVHRDDDRAPPDTLGDLYQFPDQRAGLLQPGGPPLEPACAIAGQGGWGKGVLGGRVHGHPQPSERPDHSYPARVQGITADLHEQRRDPAIRLDRSHHSTTNRAITMPSVRTSNGHDARVSRRSSLAGTGAPTRANSRTASTTISSQSTATPSGVHTLPGAARPPDS